MSQSCSKINFVPGGSKSMISGVVSPLVGSIAQVQSRSFFPLAYAAVCTHPVYANIYSIEANGTLASTSLATQTLDSTATYQFDTALLGMSLSNNVQYLVEITGCTSSTPSLSRPITEIGENQDINNVTTFVSLTAFAVPTKKINEITRNEIKQLISDLNGANASSINTVYKNVIAEPALAQKFLTTFISNPSHLINTVPNVLTESIATIYNENVAAQLSAHAVHWNIDYTVVYKWVLDGDEKATGNQWSFYPEGNDQGTHTIALYIGKSAGDLDLDGDLDIDTSVPYLVKTYLIDVLDTSPATAPSFSIASSNVSSRNITLAMNTGLAFLNCASFSNLALTEETSTAPSNPADYDITCDVAVSQAISYTLTGPGDGTKVLRLWARDASGNVSAIASTLSIELDTGLPTAAITTPVAINNTNKAAWPIAGTCSENTRSVSLSIGGTNFTPAPTCSSGAWSTTANVTAIGDNASVAISITHTDLAGNSITATSTALKDIALPTVAITTPVAINNTNKTAWPIAGTCSEDTRTVSVLVGGIVTATSTCSGNTWLTSLDISSLVDSATLSVIASHTDLAGNSITASTTVLKDISLPTVAVTTPTAINNTNKAAWPVAGTCSENTRTVSILIGGSVTATATCTSLAWSSSIDVSALSDSATLAVAATHTDFVGNSATASITVLKDIILPTVAITTPVAINNTNKAAWPIAGTCSENTRTVSLSIGGTHFTPAPTCSSGTWSTTANVTAIGDNASVAISITHTDLAGNSVTATSTALKDATVPTVAITTPVAINNVNKAAWTVSGTCSENTRTVSVLVGGSVTASPTCSSSAWSTTVNATTLTDSGAISIAVSHSDAVENTATASVNTVKDVVLPIISLTDISATLRGGQAFVETLSGSDDIALSSLILYYAQNGTTFTLLDNTLTSASTDYTWTVPAHDTAIAKLKLVATDTSGNVTTVTSAAFTIDSSAPIAPSVSLTSINPTNSTSATMTVSSCSDRVAIIVSNSATVPALSSSDWRACSTVASSLTHTLPTGDGTKSLYVFARDAVGNISTAASLSVVLDQTVPTINLSSFSGGQLISGIGSQSITWTTSDSGSGLKTNSAKVESSSDGGFSWSTVANNQTTSGPYTWGGISSVNSETYKIRITILDNAGNSATAGSLSNFTIDSTPPAYSSISHTSGPSTTSNTLTLSLTAVDAISKITHFCFKYNNSISPVVSDACWRSVASPVPGLTPAKTLSLSSYSFTLGFATGTYVVSSWLKDEAGNISELTSSGAGTINLDSLSVTYLKPIPTSVESILVTNNNSPSLPLDSTQTIFNVGNPNAFIKWKINIPSGNSIAGLKLEYLTNESSQNWISITSSLTDGSNGGCSPDSAGNADDGLSGCYLWSTPPTSYFRIRLSVTDQYGAINITSAQPSNTIPFEIIAGNLDMSIGGDARGTVINFTSTNQNTDPRALVVAPDGAIYYRDTSRGILHLDPSTGTLNVFIPLGTANASSMSNVLRSDVTLKSPYAIDVDSQGNLYIWDRQFIHKWTAATDRISTIIGGGTNTGDTIAGGLNLQITDWVWTSDYLDEANHFNVLPNGDITFKSSKFGLVSNTTETLENGGDRIRYYRASEDKIYSFFIRQGIGSRVNASLSNAQCRVLHLSYAYNPETLSLNHFHYSPGYLNSGVGSCGLSVFVDSPVLLYGPTSLAAGGELTVANVPTTSHPPTSFQAHTYIKKIGKNGKIYFVSRDWGLKEYVPATNSYVNIYGSGSSGYCDDGTTATVCNAVVTDAFITRDSRIYVMDGGMVRTIDDAGKVQTIFGQSTRHGDGLNSLIARFANTDMLRQNPITNEVYVADRNNHSIRKLASNGIVSKIAGNGVASAPASFTALATNTSLVLSRTLADTFDFLPGTQDLILSQSANSLMYRFLNSTGKWSTLTGNVAGAFAPSNGDGQLPSNINFTKDGFITNGFYKVINNKIFMQTYNGASGVTNNVQVKSYDLSDSLRQANVVGALGFSSYSAVCADTTAVASCALNQDSYRPEMGYKSDTDEYLIPDPINGRIMRIGTHKNTWVNLGQTYRGIAIDVAGGRVYFCGNDGTHWRPYVYTVSSNTKAVIAGWPTGYNCEGQSLLIDDSSGTRRLIFPVSKVGVASVRGIASLINMP